MSISTVEIRAFSGPDLVELGSAGRPTIIRLNVGPRGATGAAGPNSVTSATTSDGTANLGLATLNIGNSASTSGEITIFTNGPVFQWYSDTAEYGERGFTFLTTNITSDVNYTLPDASGTFALTSQLPTLGTNVATFLESPTSANLAAAVTGETGSGALVFGTSPTIDAPTISGSAAFTSTTRPTSAGTGTPAATSLITRDDGDARYLELLSPKIIVTTPSDLLKVSSGIGASSTVARGLLSLRTGTSGAGAAAGIALTNNVANTGTMSTAVGSGLSLVFPAMVDGAHIGLFYGGHPASLPVLLADFDNSGANGFSLQFRRNGAQFEARLTWRINGTASVSAWESLGVSVVPSLYRAFVFVTSTGIKGAIYRGVSTATYDTIDYSTPVWSRTENFTFTGNLGNWNGVTYAHSGDSTFLVSRFETLNRFSI